MNEFRYFTDFKNEKKKTPPFWYCLTSLLVLGPEQNTRTKEGLKAFSSKMCFSSSTFNKKNKERGRPREVEMINKNKI
jgi:hypothetical protein